LQTFAKQLSYLMSIVLTLFDAVRSSCQTSIRQCCKGHTCSAFQRRSREERR
jgi:hypothetical protein